MLTIAICGNHKADYCTESELVWTLTEMGHKVLKFQENQTSTEEQLRICTTQGVELWLYVHTHHWSTPGCMDMDTLITMLRQFGVQTASFHLDRFWGLDISDKRESGIGRHPFWHTDKVFTADGGHQAEFEARGVTHIWLPPAIAARHCYRGTFQKEFAVDVAFVGSANYHPEYPFRTRLVEYLTKTYGSHFRRFAPDTPSGVVRERRLNDLYASARVIVGDSCFAGSPNYWSDRVPETLGRGGFLLHPKTKGLDIDGLVTYEPGNLAMLKEKIDLWVKHGPRLVCTDKAMAVVKEHHTYTNRMRVLLTEMGLLW